MAQRKWQHKSLAFRCSPSPTAFLLLRCQSAWHFVHENERSVIHADIHLRMQQRSFQPTLAYIAPMSKINVKTHSMSNYSWQVSSVSHE